MARGDNFNDRERLYKDYLFITLVDQRIDSIHFLLQFQRSWEREREEARFRNGVEKYCYIPVTSSQPQSKNDEEIDCLITITIIRAQTMTDIFRERRYTCTAITWSVLVTIDFCCFRFDFFMR